MSEFPALLKTLYIQNILIGLVLQNWEKIRKSVVVSDTFIVTMTKRKNYRYLRVGVVRISSLRLVVRSETFVIQPALGSEYKFP